MVQAIHESDDRPRRYYRDMAQSRGLSSERSVPLRWRNVTVSTGGPDEMMVKKRRHQMVKRASRVLRDIRMATFPAAAVHKSHCS